MTVSMQPIGTDLRRASEFFLYIGGLSLVLATQISHGNGKGYISVWSDWGSRWWSCLSSSQSHKKRRNYAVRALTRNPEGAKGQELKSKGCEVVKCDLDDKESVEKPIHGSYGVFLVTDYWEHFSKEKEIDQGKRVIDVCEALGVNHLIYSGLENVKKVIGIECGKFYLSRCSQHFVT